MLVILNILLAIVSILLTPSWRNYWKRKPKEVKKKFIEWRDE
jgi:hypothetical protein